VFFCSSVIRATTTGAAASTSPNSDEFLSTAHLCLCPPVFANVSGYLDVTMVLEMELRLGVGLQVLGVVFTEEAHLQRAVVAEQEQLMGAVVVEVMVLELASKAAMIRMRVGMQV
jgi:hypothetical protein